MKHPDRSGLALQLPQENANFHAGALHPAWINLIRFCREMGFGEIERVKIQDGLPVIAEITKKKVKFT